MNWDKIKEYTSNISAIFSKEIKLYFNSPTAYVAIVVFLLISGWMYTSAFFLNDQISIRGFLDNMPLFYAFLLPAITMRLISEELKVGTIEIITTMPIKDYEIVVGKYLSALALLVVLLMLTLIYPISLAVLVKGSGLDWGQITGAYVGLFFTGASFLAIGIFSSSLTKNQIIAFIVGFIICFAFFMVGKVVAILPGFAANIVSFIGLDSHFSNVSKGVLDSRDLIYYLSLAGFFIYLTTIMLGSRKWR